MPAERLSCTCRHTIQLHYWSVIITISLALRVPQLLRPLHNVTSKHYLSDFYTPRDAVLSSASSRPSVHWQLLSITLISCVIFIRYKIVYYRRHSSLSSFAKVCLSSPNTHQVGTSLNYRVQHPRNHSPSNLFVLHIDFQHLLQVLPYQFNARPHSCTWILKVPPPPHTSISTAIMGHSHSRLQIKSDPMQATFKIK